MAQEPSPRLSGWLDGGAAEQLELGADAVGFGLERALGEKIE
jgi:hypothetical protein